MTAIQNGHTPTIPAAAGFGQRLRTYRERAALSQSRLARQCQLDHSHVGRLESGSRSPSRDTVLAISEALGLSVVERAGLMASAGYMPDEVSPQEIMVLVAMTVAWQGATA